MDSTAADGAGVPPRPPIIAPKPGVVHVFRALYDYEAQQADELSFSEGDILYVTEDTSNKDWLKARCGNKTGLIPANYIELKLDTIQNPIHDATRRGNLELLKDLLQNQVSAGSLDSAGNTGLHWSSRGGHLECCQLLLKSVQLKNQPVSEFVNAKNKLGETALHLASYKGYLEVIQLLLESGANPGLLNLNGEKAIDLAKEVDVKGLLHKYEMEQRVNENDGLEYLDDDGAEEEYGGD